MDNMVNALNKALNVDGLVQQVSGGLVEGGDDDVIEPELIVDPIEIVDVSSSIPQFIESDLAMDYKKARSIQYALVGVTAQAIGDAVSLAKEIRHPRAFDVLNNLIITMNTISKDLIKTQDLYTKVMLDHDKEVGGNIEDVDEDGNVINNTQNNTTINNFSGSTDDFLRIIEDKAKAKRLADGNGD